MPMNMGTKHGAMATGLAKAKGGVMGPGGSFTGTKNPQDVERKVGSTQVGTDSGPKNGTSGNAGVPKGKTGGMSRKFAGSVGSSKYGSK